ncbi:MAG: hypothetical protein QW292_12840 [Candidatus Parvarchaeota archaeon]
MGLIGLWNEMEARSNHNPVRIDDGFRVDIPLDELYSNGKVGVSATISRTALTLQYTDDKTFDTELADILESIKPRYFGKAKKGIMWWQRLGLFFFKNQDPKTFFELPTKIAENKKTKWKVGTCDFCGMEKRNVKQAGAGEHLLVVVPGKFSSFYSNLRGDTKICNWCAFASKFSPLRLFYTISSNSITGIAFEANDLLDLLNVYNYFSNLFAQSEWYRNFPSMLGYTQYPLETFLDFLLATMIEVQNKRNLEGKNPLESGLISNVHIIQASSGQGLSIDRYYTIPNIPKVFDFISACKWLDKNQKSHNSLLETAKILVSKQGTRVETVTREEFSRRLFYTRDVSGLLEEFLIKQIGKNSNMQSFGALNIDKFITKYTYYQMSMDSNQLNVTKQLGGLIGQLASDTDNKSLLYTLRSVGNLSDFLAFFDHLLVRYIDDIKPRRQDFETLVSEIDNTNWFTYKSLIGIFSALRYIELQTKQEELVNA